MAKVRVNFDKAGVMSSFDGGLERGLTAAAILVEADAKFNAPVDLGRLHQSITHRVEGSTGIVGTNVDYAAHVEYGTGIHSEGGVGRKTPWSYKHPKYGWVRTRGNKPQPFLRPALDNNRSKIVRIISEAIGGALK